MKRRFRRSRKRSGTDFASTREDYRRATLSQKEYLLDIWGEPE